MSPKERYWKYSLIAIILILGLLLFIKITPFLGGLLGASTIYIVIRKQMLFLTERKHWRRGVAATLLLFEVILCFLIPLSLMICLFVGKWQDLNLNPMQLARSIQQIADLIEQRTGFYVLDTSNIMSVVSLLPKIGQLLMGSISGFAINVAVLVLVLYFMLIGGRKMEEYAYSILPFSQKNKENVLEEIHAIVTSNAIGIPLLAIIQGLIALIGYWIFGVPSPFFFGFLTCIATIIPIVGTALVWFPLAGYLALTGNWGEAFGLTAYALLIISNIDNILRFILQKKMADIHPLVTIFGVIIGLSLFGIMGIIFGPLLISIFILCFNIFKEEYLDTSL